MDDSRSTSRTRLLTFSFGTLPAGYVPGTHSQLVLTLVDDDLPFAAMTFAEATVSEDTAGTLKASVAEGVAVRRDGEPEPGAGARGGAADRAHAGREPRRGRVFEGVPAERDVRGGRGFEASFTVTFADDAVVEGNETLTFTFGLASGRPGDVRARTRSFVLTVEDDDGPPAAPDVTVQTGDGYRGTVVGGGGERQPGAALRGALARE